MGDPVIITPDAQPQNSQPVTITPDGGHTIGAQPTTGSKEWLKKKFYELTDKFLNELPAVGATGGSMIGAGAGTAVEPGGGTVLGAIGGAGIGGMAGESAKQLGKRAIFNEGPTTSADAANNITQQGLLQGGIEAASAGVGMAAKPLQKAAVTQYERALAPTTRINKQITEKIAPGMMDRNIHGSLESIENRAASEAADLRPKIDAAIDAIPEGELSAFLERYKVPQVPGGSKDEIRAALAAKQAQRQAGSMADSLPASVKGKPNSIVDSVGSQAATIPESIFAAKSGTKLTTGMTAGATDGAGKKIFDDLESLRQSYIVDGKVADRQAVDAISKVQDVVAQYGDDISAKSLRRLRQIFDNPVAKAGGFAGADLSTAYSLQAKQQAANSIREIIAEASPDVAKLNKEMSFWLNVQKVASESGLRRTGQEGGLLKSLGPLAAGSAGAIGFAGNGAQASIEAAAIASMSTAIGVASRTPAWRTSSALFKRTVADAMASGDVRKVFSMLGRFGVTPLAGAQTPGTSDQTSPR